MTNSNKNQVSNNLLSEIAQALESVKYGSIEIFVQNKVVTQITVRNIHKTSVEIEKEETTHISSHSHQIRSTKIETHSHIQNSSVKVR
jgi:hypothetical protein